MADMNPFAGLIRQIEGYRPPVQKKMRMPRIDPYDRITAVSRMARGESPSVIAHELGVTKGAVLGWQRKARAEAEAREAERG
ncbi:hypothetical protein ACWKWV_09975 [Castellaniella ginsengisoli]